MLADLVAAENLLPGSYTAVFSLSAHMVERDCLSDASSSKGTNPTCEGSTLTT